MLRQILLFSLFILLSTMGSVGFAAEKSLERRPFPEEYVDADTGIHFPSRIASFKKNEVVKNFNPLIGTVVRYADAEGNCADVYLYSLDSGDQPLSDESVLKHFREIKKAIENLPKKNSHINDVQVLGEEPFRILPGVFGKTASFRINIGGDVRNSDLTVFSYRNRIVKIRISSSPYMSNEENPFSSFLEGIAEAFRQSSASQNEKNEK